MANLITLDDYKILEGINSTTSDEKFEYLITATSKLVRTYTGQDFDAYVASPGKTEIFDIQWSTYTVQLAETPVIGVVSVFERSNQADSYVELFANGTNSKYEWYFDNLSESVFRTTESGSYRDWPRGVGAVKVIYTAGYATIPYDLKLAVADLITYYHKDEYKERQSIGSASREGNSTSNVRNDPGFPDHIRRVLDLYRV
jgi:hypothetical protein